MLVRCENSGALAWLRMEEGGGDNSQGAGIAGIGLGLVGEGEEGTKVFVSNVKPMRSWGGAASIPLLQYGTNSSVRALPRAPGGVGDMAPMPTSENIENIENVENVESHHHDNNRHHHHDPYHDKTNTSRSASESESIHDHSKTGFSSSSCSSESSFSVQSPRCFISTPPSLRCLKESLLSLSLPSNPKGERERERERAKARARAPLFVGREVSFEAKILSWTLTDDNEVSGPGAGPGAGKGAGGIAHLEVLLGDRSRTSAVLRVDIPRMLLPWVQVRTSTSKSRFKFESTSTSKIDEGLRV